LSYNVGAPAGYTGSPGDGQNCTGCHLGSASVSSGIITSTVPVSGYVGGTSYTVTVTLTGTGNKGFEISPQDAAGSLKGTLIAGSGQHLTGSGKYITHSTYITSNPAVWTFQWTAPIAGSGDVTLYGAFVNGKLNTILSTLILNDASITGPTLMANPSTLTGFSYYYGSGPSSLQSFNLIGSQLTGAPGNTVLSAPADYEISLDNITYSNSGLIPFSSSSLTSTPVYVRLKSGLAAGNYNSELISISGGGATAINVTCNGSVSSAPAPVLTVSPLTLTGFNYVLNSGPSASQTYNLSGSNLTGFPNDITITTQTYFEISTDNSSFSSGLTIPFSGATLASTPIYVRLKAGLAVASYNSEIISNTGGGASNATVTCSGSVTSVPLPTLSINPSTLNGFTYVTGSGPSASQTYNLGGTNLTGYPGNIIITAPTDFEISSDNSTFTTSLNVAYTSATLASTPIYVRLKAGLAVASYNSEIVANAGAGATTVNVTCSGNVTNISTSCGNETFTNIPTTTPTSYSARTWIGDNGNTWNATTARTDQTLTGKAICFKGYVESPVSTNGLGDLTVTTKFPFSDGTYNMPVMVNGVQVGTVPVSSTITTTTLTGINVDGNVQIKFSSDGTKRPIIDDLTWTCYTVVTNSTDIQNEYFKFLLYPNPATSQVICSAYFTADNSGVIEIRNYLGQKVYAESDNFIAGSNTVTLDLNKFEKGIYYVTIKSADGKIRNTKPLVIQ
jgi:hypothetical protein